MSSSISVAIVAYNQVAEIERTIDACLGQSLGKADQRVRTVVLPLDQAILDAALGELPPVEIGDNKEEDDG